MKTALSLLFTLLLISATAQDVNKLYFDSRSGEETLIDLCDRNGLKIDDLFASYYKDGYASYKPDKEIVKELKIKLKGVKLIVVMGTWCYDSQVNIPRFYKVLDQARFKTKNMEMVAVNRSKKTSEYDISKLSISRVPTMIVFKEGIEIGRITENPETSLEEDLLKILE